MAPYSPSNPGRRSTCPSRRRRMPSATQGPASRCRSSMGTSRRIVNSGPRVCSKRSYCSRVFFSRRPSRRWRRRSPPAGGQALEGLGFLRPEARRPVGQLLHPVLHPDGQLFPAHRTQSAPFRRLGGVRHTPQFRCPSRWYFPSSGKNSRVPRSPSPVRIAWTSSG